MFRPDYSGNNKQIGSLDGLRGFAALLVLVSHACSQGLFILPYLDLQGVGKAGVFLFFLLSAFLLTLPLLKQGPAVISTKVMSYYWQRRFLRIYPLYIIYLFLAIFTTNFFSIFLEKPNTGIPFALDFYGLIKHLLLLEGHGVTWSIAVEFKFYFLLPFLLYGISLLRPLGLKAIISFILALIIVIQIFWPQGASLTNDSRLWPYLPIFLVGVLLAVIQNFIDNYHNKSKILVALKYLGYLGVMGIIFTIPLVYSLIVKDVQYNYFHKQFILFAILWSLVLLSAVNCQGLIQRFFSLPILRFYGAISFAIYLFHPIFLDLVAGSQSRNYWAFWLVLAGSTIAAYLSYRHLEKPISNLSFTKN